MTNEIRQTLSALWIFLVVNYLFCDVLSLMDPHLIRGLATGNVPGLALDETFLLVSGIVMEIPMAMILASRFLPYRANRLANLVAAPTMALVQAASFFMGDSSTLHYWFFSAIEISAAGAITLVAWRWTAPSDHAEPSARPRTESSDRK